jgi:hypothetical protein
MPEPLTEEQFREGVYAKYRDHFDHVWMLHQLAESAIQTYRTFADTHHKAAQSLIFGRAYKSFDSIRRLCEVASCEDAGVLLRNLLNLLAVTRWISIDPPARAKRYFDWYWVSLKIDADKFPDQVPRSWLPSIQTNFDRVRPQFEYKNRRNQLRFAKHWYQPEASTIADLFEQVQMKREYEEAYSPLSSIEHSDINAFFAMTANVDRTGDERRLEIQSDLFVPHYLRNAFQYFADIFKICNLTIPLSDAAKLDVVIQSGVAFYADDIKKRRGLDAL